MYYTTLWYGMLFYVMSSPFVLFYAIFCYNIMLYYAIIIATIVVITLLLLIYY